MKKNSLRTAAAVLSVVAAAGLAGCRSSNSDSAGDASKTPTVRIMVGGIDKVIYLPAMLTQQLGYFKDAGVNVKLLTEPSGASAENVLLAGQVEGVVGFYDHSITLQAQGKCVESVVQLAKVPGEAEVVSTKAASKLTSAADFKGRKLGVTSPGSSTDYLTQYLAKKNGVETADYTTVAAGAGSTFTAALQNGGIDAGMTTDPTIATVTSQGLGKVMIDMRTEEGTKAALGGLYPAASMYMDCGYVQKNPETVQKVVDAFVKTLGWISTHDASQIAAKMPKDYAAGNPDLYTQSIKDSSPMFTTDGVMPDGGPETVLDVLGTFSETVKAKKDDIDLSKTYTTKFAKAAS
ncbi:ABC transporter substrate-binding protein [Nocardioides pocheonensis]|uniref:ABC transporter substrate-binding protein n=1 Tax=Nocardioides pocheonensis TaxID=661485 RepID=A0A3N0GTX0_9ACTN|nr:ABC transporter substrate-binding protein [Nocardioides pocheonensis]RNM15915.1 ABC transporter substrate-binding protein [Nocardioides pocheonensis]